MSKKYAKRALISAATVFMSAAASNAAFFVPGDLVVYRVGTGAAALSSGSTAVFLDEYSTSGGASPTATLAMPTSASGSNNPLTASGTASSEGELTLSGNGNDLLVTGYATAPGTTSVANTNTSGSGLVLRDIGVIDAFGDVDTSTTTTSFSGNNIRSVASQDGVTLYAAGANTGIISLTDGGSGAGTLISSTSTNNRQLEVVGGQLYASTGSGSLRLVAVGSGLPTTTGNTATEVAGIPVGTTTNSSNSGSQVAGPYSYVFSSSTGGATPDTLYIADNGWYQSKTSNTGVIEKYDLVNGTYQSDGYTDLVGVTGLIGSSSTVANVTTETLYATTPTGIYELTDSGLGTLANTNTPTLIASAGSNEQFRGIAFAPAAPVPEPAMLGLLTLGGMGLLHRRRRI